MRAVGMLDGELRLSSPLLAVDAGEAVPYLPHAPKTDERCPRVWRGASSLNVSKYRPSLDKVFVVPKRDHYRWGWWSLASFLERGLLALAPAQAVPQLTRCLMKRSIHVTVDDASLEAGVSVAKPDSRWHDVDWSAALEDTQVVVFATRRDSASA